MNNSLKKTILIVEDEEIILGILGDFLKSEGYNVLVAENGLRALDLIEECGVPNLVLLDMVMPVMNGWNFAQEVFARFNHFCPIVIMTAAADAEKRAEDICAVGWIEKPFDLDKLIELIKKYERGELEEQSLQMT